MQLGCSRPVQAGLAREVELVITSAQRRITPMAMQAGGAACLLLLSLAAFAPLPTRARPDADEIHALPGWDGALPSRMWSGYVSAGTAEEAGVFHALFGHYFFVESERSPTTDPLVVWTNGGPGAASFFGLFVEMGPLLLSSQSVRTAAYNETGVPTLYRNPYAWTKVANVLILNGPAPVGYSFCTPAGPSGDGNSCGTWNDTKTATYNADFLENWAAAFPDLLTHEWYLVGESYAGVYVPTLARELLHRESARGCSVARALRGLAVGDGCVGTEVLCGGGGRGPGPYFRLEFLHGHGQFSHRLYERMRHVCPREQLVGYNGVIVQDPTCLAILREIDAQVGGFYAYNLYDDCWYQNGLEPPHQHPHALDASSSRRWWGPPRRSKPAASAVAGVRRVQPDSGGGGSALPDDPNGYLCGGPQAMFEWIETAAVRAALHVSAEALFFSGDNGEGFTYNLTERNLMPFYKHLAMHTSLRVLVYNGDTDPGLNSFAAENWTSALGLEEAEAWRPWTVDGRSYVGGYVTRYAGQLDFLTVRGSGHMVPEYKPLVTLEFLTRWLADQPWRRYRPDALDRGGTTPQPMHHDAWL